MVTVNLEGTFKISPSEARELYLINNGNVTMLGLGSKLRGRTIFMAPLMDLKET